MFQLLQEEMKPNASKEVEAIDPAILMSLSSVLIVAALITICVNSLTVILICRTSSLRKPAFIFTANITMADLIFSLFVLPQYVASLLLNSTTAPFGRVSCYVQVYASNSTIATTIYFMAATAVFRMLQVCYARIYIKVFTRKFMITFCSVCWIIPFIACVSCDDGVQYDSAKFICKFNTMRYLYVFGGVVFIPTLIIMSIAYGNVLHFIRQSRRRVEAHASMSTETVIIHKDKYVFKLVAAIMIIFIVSIIIPNVFYGLTVRCAACDKRITDLLGSWLVRLRPTTNFIAILATCKCLRSMIWSQRGFC